MTRIQNIHCSYCLNLFLGGFTGKVVDLAHGYHEYAFQVKIPYKIPASMTKSSKGGVRYSLQAVLKRPTAHFDYKSTPAFVEVNGRLDLNMYPRAGSIRCSQKEKEVCCFCCKAGPVSYKFKLLKRGFIPSEKILYHVQVNNPTKRRIKFSVTLLQVEQNTEAHYCFTNIQTIMKLYSIL